MGKAKRPRQINYREQKQSRAITPAVERPRAGWAFFLICALLVVSTLAVYWQVTTFKLMDVDDPEYITNNTHVRDGLTRSSIAWAFTIDHTANWHPLTWMSHMLDCQIFGLAPGLLHGTGGHHLTNLLFHLANTILLFIVLTRFTGYMWRSAFVAGLFALHPLHVESVAWVAERKDVLSTFFMMLTLWAYSWYAERPNVKRYLLVAAAFALGLMSKQMLVSLPILLLLLDYWPLRRTKLFSRDGIGIGKLFAEKIPLFALSLAASTAAFVHQGKGEAITERFSLGSRIANAVVTYIVYLANTLWPQNLAHYYPHEGILATWQVAGSAVLLVAITYLAVRLARSHSYLIVGWLWYLITLVPVIGLIQVGAQARADRYTYIPLIGIFVMVAFAIPELFSRWVKTSPKPILATSSAVVIGALILPAHTQVSYWENSEKLYTHTLSVTENNWFVHSAIAAILNDQATTLRANGQRDEANKKNEEAIRHLKITLEIMPGMADAHNCLAVALNGAGKFDESIVEYEKALSLQPNDSLTHCNVGAAFLQQGKLDQAIGHLRSSLEIDPTRADAHYNLAIALRKQGHSDESLAEFRKVLDLYPSDWTTYWTYNQMAIQLSDKGQTAEAIDLLKKAVQINDRTKVDGDQNAALRNLQRLEQKTVSGKPK